MNTFYHGDCLFVMNHDIEPESVDLIYLDPPFFTGKVQKGTQWKPDMMEVSYDDSKSFWGDTKRCEDARKLSPIWVQYLASTQPDFASYLWYMIQRLLVCHKVLKATGSIYLHCDWRASHYLKMIMDNIFGFNNFKSEIIWYRSNKIPDTRKRLFYKTHDAILFYTKSSDYIFNHIKEPTGKTVRRKKMKKINGRITNTDEIIEYQQHISKNKSVITDIPDISISQITDTSERVGYPTQKPIRLLERLIITSTNEGDIVLDPFCGCGTAVIASHKLGRRWIGIDINKTAYDVIISRVKQLSLFLQGYFSQSSYIERTINDVLNIDKPNGKDSFEEWVNEYFKARKPTPDKGIDGITPDNIPIQSKTFVVDYSILSKLVTDAKYHSQVKQPFTRAIVVSQKGFDDGARQRQFEIQTKENITIDLLTPEIMLNDKEVK